MTKNEWKVGDKAKASTCEIVLKFIGNTIAVGDVVGGCEVSVLINSLTRIQTSAEIERERVVELAYDAINYNLDQETERAINVLYDAGMLVDPSKKVKPLSVDKWLIDSGYSKNGSASNFINELIDEGYIIGADND